jgi:DNA-binding response OmpR family regulator
METHILLVEDDSTARMLLADVLSRAGYQVSTAQDGEIALTMLPNHMYDVVITDIRMRNVDGIKVLEAARARQLPPAVILLTGYGSLETAVSALRAGANDYLLKPIDPDELLNHVASAVERRNEELRKNDAVHIIAQGLAQLQGQSSASASASAAQAEPQQPNQPQQKEKESLPAEPQEPAPASSVSAEDRFITVGALQLDTFRHTGSFEECPLHLTPIEYSMLRCLADSPGRVLSYSEIVRRSHGHDPGDSEAQSLLKAHIRNIRRKIAPDYLVNVRGIGYMLVDPTQPDTPPTAP